MVRAFALFAVLAVASAARRNKQKNKFDYPDASQYTVEGAETSTPGGTFNVQGIISLENILDLQNPVLQYCPTDANFLGKFDIMPQLDTQEVNWRVTVLDKSGGSSELKKVTGTSAFQTLNTDALIGFNFDQADISGNFSFLMSQQNYNYRVEVTTTEVRAILLNREYGLGNCNQVLDAWRSDNMIRATKMDQPRNNVGLSDFTIQQTSQGGFRLDADIDWYTSLQNPFDLHNEVLETIKFGSWGSYCNFTDPIYGDFDFDYSSRPKRKNPKNKNAAGRCPSFQANATSFGQSGGFDFPEPTEEWAMSLGSFYGFEAAQPYYNAAGERDHFTVYVLVVQVFPEQDYWAAIVADDDNGFIVFLAQRTGLVDSQLTAQQLKHKETRNKMPFKQGQRSSGHFIARNANAKKPTKIVSSSYENDFKREKPRSWKKGTKSKVVNRKRARKQRKAAKKARVTPNVAP